MNITSALIIAFDQNRQPILSAIMSGSDREIEFACRSWLDKLEHAHLVIAYQIDETTFVGWEARQIAHAGMPWIE